MNEFFTTLQVSINFKKNITVKIQIEAHTGTSKVVTCIRIWNESEKIMFLFQIKAHLGFVFNEKIKKNNSIRSSKKIFLFRN